MQQNQNPNKVAATAAPRRVISLLVDNHNGVLARVSSLFCRRGFNIDSLTVSATNDPTRRSAALPLPCMATMPPSAS